MLDKKAKCSVCEWLADCPRASKDIESCQRFEDGRTELRRAMRKIAVLIERRKDIGDQMRHMEFVVREILKTTFPEVDYLEFYSEKGWVCEQSPIGTCVYDDEKDPVHDNCLVCGEPYERK